LVWDSFQADMTRKNIDKTAQIMFVGPLPFSCSTEKVPEIPRKAAAVFDFVPQRPSLYSPITTYAEYRHAHPDLSLRFINDVYDVLSEFEYIMLLKIKRNIGNRSSKSYRRIVSELGQRDNVLLINPDISPVKLIERCEIVISIPFTSTAIYKGKPNDKSVYYDPTGWAQKTDRAAHDFMVLTGKQELRSWVMSMDNLHSEISELDCR
jgi:polysaccharide biosynthesis PFTS motif protein